MEHSAGAFLLLADGFSSVLLARVCAVCALGVAALLMLRGGGEHMPK